MKNESIDLTYNQVMAFMIELDKIKKNNPYFNDGIASNFENFVINRTAEIVTTYPQLKLKIIPNANKYQLSRSIFDYMTRLTKVDVYNKEVMKQYDEQLEELLENNLKEQLVKKTL